MLKGLAQRASSDAVAKTDQRKRGGDVRAWRRAYQRTYAAMKRPMSIPGRKPPRKSLAMDTSAAAPYTIIKMLGGITVAMAPVEVIKPSANFSS
jgi:hypothetical protein